MFILNNLSIYEVNKYVESRLCVSSGLGKVYSQQFLVYPFTQNTIAVTYVTLFIYRQKLNAYGSKTCFNPLFHFIVTEMKEDTVNSIAM